MTMRLEYKKTSTLLLNDDVLKELIKVGNFVLFFLQTKALLMGKTKALLMGKTYSLL